MEKPVLTLLKPEIYIGYMRFEVIVVSLAFWHYQSLRLTLLHPIRRESIASAPEPNPTISDRGSLSIDQRRPYDNDRSTARLSTLHQRHSRVSN
jgi:hypothetical protein